MAPKWHLTYGGEIQVLRTQLLDLVVEQSAQISYRIIGVPLSMASSSVSSASRASSKLVSVHFHEDKLVLKEDINVDKILFPPAFYIQD